MALPPTFTNRVATSVVPLAPREIADSGIAGGLSVLGRAGTQALDRRDTVNDQVQAAQQRTAELQAERNRQAAQLDFGAKFGQAQVGLAETIDQLEQQPAPGGAGHTAAVRQALDTAWGKLADGVTINDREAFDGMRAQFDDYATRQLVRAQSFEAAQRVKKAGDDFDTYAASSDVLTYNDPTPDTFFAQDDADQRFIAQLPLGDDAKAKLLTKRREDRTRALFSGMLDKGGQDALAAVIDSGAFDKWMGGDQEKSRWRQRANTAQDAAQRASDAADLDRQRAALDGLKSLQIDIQNGNPPSQAVIEKAMADARTAGVKDPDLKTFAYLADDGVRARQAQGLTTPALQTGLQDLQDRMNAGTATLAERKTATAYQDELKARDQKEATNISALLKQPGGEAQAVAMLTQQTPERRWAAANAAGQGRLAVYANMRPLAAQIAIEGHAKRMDRPADFLPPKDDITPANGGQARAEAIFRAMLGPDLVDQLGGTFKDHLEASLDAMAGDARGWNEERFRTAVQVAFGATKRASGEWQGGIGQLKDGQRFEVPAQWTAREFDQQWQHLAFQGGAYSDGTPANPADIRAHYTPRYIGEDKNGNSLYYLMRGVNPLYRADGKGPLQLTVGATPQTRLNAQSSQQVLGYDVVTNPDKSTWARRADGSEKSMGWLGLLRRPDGGVSSEISVGVEIGGKEREIPLIVPGLNKPELDYLMTHQPDLERNPSFLKNMPASIMAKAQAHARERIAAGKSPFWQPGDPRR